MYQLSLTKPKFHGNKIINPAMEAGARVVNVDDETMHLALLTDKIIAYNQLKEVDNPIFTERGGLPTPTGLFSQYIFGNTNDERKKTCAYIDLKTKLFHPYVWEVLTKLYSNLDRVAAGEGTWFIEPNGKLVEIKDESNPKYDEDNTGLRWLIENFDKIDFGKTNSRIRDERITLIKSLTPDEMFISRYIVVPVFFRDMDNSTGRASIPSINYEYKKLIVYANSIADDTLGLFSNKAMYNMQQTLVTIRKFGQSLIEKKKGAIHQSILGKSVDRGGRDVISVPVLDYAETPDDCLVDITHAGIPIGKCLVLGYPFILRWVLEFFTREFENRRKVLVYAKNNKGVYIPEEVEIEDQTSIYTKDYIDKRMKSFINTYGARFEPIKIYLKDGSVRYMRFTGNYTPKNPDSPYTSVINNRPMTWTDLFYIAAVQTLSDKHIWITRYPVTGVHSTFPVKCRPCSTMKTMPVKIDDVVYPFYPVIDSKMDTDDVSRQFIDTIEISNLFLAAIGGDYDGDQTSEKMSFTIEANQEAAEIMGDVKQYLGLDGGLIRKLGNEAALTFYAMTYHD